MDVKVERVAAIWAKGLLSLFHTGTTSKWADTKHITALSSNLYQICPWTEEADLSGQGKKGGKYFFFKQESSCHEHIIPNMEI